MSSAPRRRTGRRPGDSGSRDAVLAAARTAFAAAGYRGATIRAIAREAGVDPSLVLHFFGSKDGLFEAAMRPPVDPAPVLRAALARDPAGAGRAVAEFALATWEDPALRQGLLGIVRAAATEEAAAEMLRRQIAGSLVGPLAEVIDAPDAELRAELVASQILGLAMIRYVLGVEPLASAPPAALVAWLAPNLQRVLVGEPDPGPEER